MAKKKQKNSKHDIQKKRPPIVVVLGHVDHGKTTLLDYIRKTGVASKETGGITQKIGAYQIKKPSKITFIDTPGHEAFSAMRSRGAKVADLAILVVAADDSVMPQTEESIKFIKQAGIPFIVAINKVDLAESDTKKVKKDLLRIGVACEGYGGEIVAVEISAKTGKGVEDLLEMVGLVSEMKTNLNADPQEAFEGVVIESSLNKRQGALATVLVKNGTLKVKDNIVVGSTTGRVKALFDEFGKKIDTAPPSKPVAVLGLGNVVDVGLIVSRNGKLTQTQESRKEIKNATVGRGDKNKVIKLIVKAGSKGELESVIANLPSGVEILRAQTSNAINESDVEFAAATKSAIVGFNVEIPSSTKKLAQTQRVVLRSYNLIYKLIEEIDEVVEELTREPVEVTTGRAKVLAKFKIDDLPVAGVRIEDGEIRKGDKVKIERENEVLKGKVISVKQGKVEINKTGRSGEYGIGVSDSLDFSKGDVIMAYNIE